MATQAGPQSRSVSSTKPAAWDDYWTDAFQANDRRALLISELCHFFCSRAGWPLAAGARTWYRRVPLDLDWAQMAALSRSRDLQEAMHHAPSEALACIGAAVHEALFVQQAQRSRAEIPGLANPGKVLVRLHNHRDSFMPISAVRADQVSRLVTIRGTVSRATPVRPLVTALQFVCDRCGSAQAVPFPDGRFQQPATCGADGCRSRSLAPNRAAATCVDWQRVTLQPLPRDERGGEGRVPRPMEVELLEDLTESCAPGDVVTVTGLVKVVSGEPASGRRFGDAKRQCLFLPYIEALSVVASSKENQPSGVNQGNGADLAVVPPEGLSFLPPNMPGFTNLDLDFVRTFTASCEGDQLRQLVHSLCPGICGMEGPKAGLLLALFGGVSKGGGGAGSTSGTGSIPVRGDIHVLMVGDPGLGKSQLLQAAAAAAPRGVYVCGSSTTSAGLTVSVARDGGEFCFDAGALVLADRGVCCVDDFDKASAEHGALLGAMEQQEVSVAKAGLVAALPARTTVLAAANPVDGQYNRGKTLMQNLKMTPAMLSRFDLVFLLLDRPDAERDQQLTDHVMAVHSGLAGRAGAARARMLEGSSAPLMLTDGGGAPSRPPLLQRLRQRRPDDEPLPQQLLRKYIAYARQYCHPRLSPAAAAVIKAFYLHLRRQSASGASGPPVTHRQLESLVRLSEARARVDLREEVAAEDAEDAVEVMKQTLDGMMAEGPGMIDFTAGSGGGRGGGGGRGFQPERRRFVEALQRHCWAKGDAEVESAELYDLADRLELAVDVSSFLEQLNEAGDLLKRGTGKWKLNGSIRGGAAAQLQRSTQAGWQGANSKRGRNRDEW